MTSPLVQLLDLTYAMLAAAKDGAWREFWHLHARRAQLLQTGLNAEPDAPWRLPQLFAAQSELAAIKHVGSASPDDETELLGPLADALVAIPIEPRGRCRSPGGAA